MITHCISLKATAVTPLKVLTELWFLHSAFPLLAVYQYIKFHFIPFYTFRDIRSFLPQKLKRGSDSVNTGDKDTILAFCNSPYGPLSVYQVSLNDLQYFRDMLRTKWDGRTDGQRRLEGQGGDYMLSLRGA